MNKQKALERLDALEKEAVSLRKIINQTGKTLNDITDVDSALKILGESRKNKANLSVNDTLLLIIKAANFVDNNESVWEPDFTNNNEYKWAPYFQKTSSGWSLHFVTVWLSFAYFPVGFYFKNKSTGELIVKRFIDTYIKWLEYKG